MNSKRFNYLLKNLRKSDSLFSELYRFYYPKIRIHVYRKFRNQQLSEDIAQDFFVKLFTLDIHDFIETPTAWVYTICDNMAKNAIRKLAREFPVDVIPHVKEMDGYERDLYGECFELLMKLTEENRELIIKHIFEGYSLKELAKAMDIEYPAMKKRYNRAIKSMKQMSPSRS